MASIGLLGILLRYQTCSYEQKFPGVWAPRADVVGVVHASDTQHMLVLEQVQSILLFYIMHALWRRCLHALLCIREFL